MRGTGNRGVIDVGCGPGRFWPVMAQANVSDMWGLDVSHSMLSFAKTSQSVGQRFTTIAGSVTALPFADESFDCVVAMRLLHHFGDLQERKRALSELRRIARRNVIVSLWVDGNYKAWRRKAMERRRPERDYQNRHVFQRTALVQEFSDVDLSVVRYLDLIPAYSQWRYYLLACTSS